MNPTLVARFLAKVDVTPGCWIWTGAKLVDGYGYMYLGGSHATRRKEYAHRLSYMIHRGPIPQGMHIDHICHVPACVAPSHLRVVTPKQNGENRNGANRNSTSGIRGVTWDKERGRWLVHVKHNRANHYGGRFIDLEDAGTAAKALREFLFTHDGGL